MKTWKTWTANSWERFGPTLALFWVWLSGLSAGRSDWLTCFLCLGAGSGLLLLWSLTPTDGDPPP